MIVMAVGNLKRDRVRALAALRELLSDETVVMYALMGLRKLRAEVAPVADVQSSRRRKA